MQGTSVKPQAQRLKLQATSVKLLDHGSFIKFNGPRTEALGSGTVKLYEGSVIQELDACALHLSKLGA